MYIIIFIVGMLFFIGGASFAMNCHQKIIVTNEMRANRISLKEEQIVAWKRRSAVAFCILISAIGFLGVIGSIFLPSLIGTCPILEEYYSKPLLEVYPSCYVYESNPEWLLVKIDSIGELPIPKSDFEFSLLHPDTIWNSLEINEVEIEDDGEDDSEDTFEPTITVYHGENNIGNSYIKVVLVIPKGSIW